MRSGVSVLAATIGAFALVACVKAPTVPSEASPHDTLQSACAGKQITQSPDGNIGFCVTQDDFPSWPSLGRVNYSRAITAVAANHRAHVTMGDYAGTGLYVTRTELAVDEETQFVFTWDGRVPHCGTVFLTADLRDESGSPAGRVKVLEVTLGYPACR